MIDKIRKIVNKNKVKIAYKINDKYITYNDLWNISSKYAELLKKQGTSPVIIYSHKDINTIISILSCIIANRTYVPVDLSTPLFRLHKIAIMTSSELILTDSGIKIDNIDCITLNELERFNNQEIKESNNEIVYIIFTSGSTGNPKGVPISKTNLNNFIDWICNLKPLSDYNNINVLNQANFSFDLSVADLFYSLCMGHTLISYDGNMEDNYNGIFNVMKLIDVAIMTPTFIKLCLLNEDFNHRIYPKLKCIYFCGEELEIKTVKKLFEVFPNIKVINAYGPTEATSAVSALLITKEMIKDNKILPVGDVNSFATTIEIIDDEIVLKGKSVFNGYIGGYVGGYYKENNINCYKTGDIGYIKDGKLYCIGRKDRQVKYKGYRIELDEIEYNINQIKGVKESAVIAKYNDEGIVKTIKAFVVLDNIDTNYVKNKLEQKLPHYMIPKTIKIISKLPINSNGKIDRKALSEL